MLRPLLKAGKWNWRVGNHMTERRQLHIATPSGSGFEPDSKCRRLWQEPEGWTIACEPSLHAAETSLLAAFRVKVPIQFSNSSRQLTPSLPGIAVRRTASLPLAYARQSIFFGRCFVYNPGFGVSRHLSPCGRGRIASPDAIRVRGYGLTIDRAPSPQPSPTRGEGARRCLCKFSIQISNSQK